MRSFRSLILALSLAASAALVQAEDQSAQGVVQQLFDAMSSHNVVAAKALFLPGASLASLRADGTTANTAGDKFAEHLGATQDSLLERMWNPKVLEQGNIAVVWAEYDFHLNGKFHHCGIDSV